MKKITALMATVLALATPAMAQAATPDGTHRFSGTLEVRKGLPLWTSCSVVADVNVTGGIPVLQDVTLSGSSVCDGISFTGLPSGALNTGSLPLVVVPSVGVTIAFPAGTCAGNLTLVWGGNLASPRSITFVDGTSNLPGSGLGLPCRIKGALTQTSTPAVSL
jgi:hypothetical protein